MRGFSNVLSRLTCPLLRQLQQNQMNLLKKIFRISGSTRPDGGAVPGSTNLNGDGSAVQPPQVLLRIAIDHLAQGNCAACVETLRQAVAGEATQHVTEQRLLPREDLHRLLTMAVSLRDRGASQPAEEILRLLHDIDRDYVDAAVEVAVLKSQNGSDPRSVLTYISGLGDARIDPRLLLVEANAHLKVGDYPAAFATVEKLPAPTSFKGWLQDQYVQLVTRLTCWHLKNGNCLARLTPQPGEKFLDGKARRVSAIFSQDQDSEVCLGLVRFLAFEGGVSDPDARQIVEMAIRLLEPPLPAGQLGALFQYLVAVGSKEGAEKFLAKFGANADLRRDARFIKFLDLYSGESDRHRELLRKCVRAFAQDGEIRHSDGQSAGFSAGPFSIRLSELAGRYPQIKASLPNAIFCPVTTPFVTSSPSPARRHVFIGMFGQLRSPRDVLPKAMEFLRQDTRQWIDLGHAVSYGVSTWDREGIRVLSPTDPAIFAYLMLPHELVTACQALGIGTISDMQGVLPALTSRLMKDSRVETDVTAEAIRDLAGSKVLVDMSSDAAFMNGSGAEIAAEYPGEPHVLNQGRMWNRIAALGELCAEAARISMEPVTDVLLLRADLTPAGHLTSFLEERDIGETNVMWIDRDPYALTLDGIGDRVFVGDIVAANRLFDGQRVYQSIVRDKNLLQTYRWNFAAHRFPMTLLYEHGTAIRQIGPETFHYDLHRAKLSLADIATELRLDMESTSRPEVKQVCQGLLVPLQ